jgi:hypothetical protein
VVEKQAVCSKVGVYVSARAVRDTRRGRNAQSPSGSSALSFARKTLSERAASSLSNRLVFAFFSSFSFGKTANLGSTPGSVGKKKGACSRGFGGSFGLFRCYKVTVEQNMTASKPGTKGHCIHM